MCPITLATICSESEQEKGVTQVIKVIFCIWRAALVAMDTSWY